MALQSSGSITARDISIELGYTQGAETKIGDYRLNGGQDFGGVKLPVSENVPTSGAIKFSDFYNARRTLVVDYYSQNENKPQTAKDRFIGRSKVVVGGFVGNTENTSGKKVVILVNKDIGSDKNRGDSCALRTGTGWSNNTVLEVLVGPNGEVLGAGGNGGSGRFANTGNPGRFGTSAIGIQYEGVGGGTRVTIQSGGRVAAGGGGGGGGGGARVTREIWWGTGSTRYATGGNGGGGAGLPAGTGASPQNAATKLNAGNATVGTNSGGNPGAVGGNGGIGGFPAQGGNGGSSGSVYGGPQENPAAYGGGGGGSAGAAIRRNPGYTVVIQNLGPPSQLLGTTSATGIT